jgi:tyrosine aminotransferase
LNADILSTAIAQIPGLSCQKPQGALYILVKLHGNALGGTNDVDFCKALYREQGLFLMPGSCFDAPGYVRLVIASPADVTREVAVRLRDFCMRGTERA